MTELFTAAPLAWVMSAVGVIISVVVIALAWIYRPVEARTRYRRDSNE